MTSLLVLVLLVSSVLRLRVFAVEYNLTEQLPVGTIVGDVRADSGLVTQYEPEVLARMRYNLQANNGSNYEYFNIDSLTSLLRVARIVDREILCPYRAVCDVTVYVKVTPVDFLQFVKVIVHIVDINDWTPSFPAPGQLTLNISNTLSAGTLFPLPAADDKDGGMFAIQTYRLVSRDVTNNTTTLPFDVRTVSLSDGSCDVRLVLTTTPDRTRYSLSLVAIDGGNPPRTGSLIVDVIITGGMTSDTLRFDSDTYTASVAENCGIGSHVTQVRATASSGYVGRIVYALDEFSQTQFGQVFSVVNTTGDVYVTGAVDYEQLKVCSLTITARDETVTSLSAAYTRLTVTVTDTNDNKPSVTVLVLTPSGTPVLPSNSPIGTAICHVTCSDLDSGSNGRVTCFSNSTFFTLQPSSQTTPTTTEYSLMSAVLFGRSHQLDPYLVTITCSDSGLPVLSTSRQLAITLTDSGPRLPAGHVVADYPDNNVVGDIITVINATTNDTGPAAALSYAIASLPVVAQSTGVSIGVRSGVVIAEKVFQHSVDTQYKYLITVTDSALIPLSATAVLTLRLVDSMPHFTQPIYAFTLRHYQPTGTSIGHVTATVDPPSTGCSYTLRDSTSLRIDATSGLIVTSRPLPASVYHVTVMATNRDRVTSLAAANVSVFVIEASDGTATQPVFVFPTLSDNRVFVSRDAPLGWYIAQLVAETSDTLSRVRYSIVGGNEDSKFVLEEWSGVIQIASPPGPTGTVYVLAVTATTSNSSMAAAVLLITVTASIHSTTNNFVAAESTQQVTSSVVIATTVSVSVVIIIVIIVVVVVVVCRGRRQKQQQKTTTIPTSTTTTTTTTTTGNNCGAMFDDVSSVARVNDWISEKSALSCSSRGVYSSNNSSRRVSSWNTSTRSTNSFQPTSASFEHDSGIDGSFRSHYIASSAAALSNSLSCNSSSNNNNNNNITSRLRHSRHNTDTQQQQHHHHTLLTSIMESPAQSLERDAHRPDSGHCVVPVADNRHNVVPGSVADSGRGSSLQHGTKCHVTRQHSSQSNITSVSQQQQHRQHQQQRQRQRQGQISQSTFNDSSLCHRIQPSVGCTSDVTVSRDQYQVPSHHREPPSHWPKCHTTNDSQNNNARHYRDLQQGNVTRQHYRDLQQGDATRHYRDLQQIDIPGDVTRQHYRDLQQGNATRQHYRDLQQGDVTRHYTAEIDLQQIKSECYREQLGSRPQQDNRKQQGTRHTSGSPDTHYHHNPQYQQSDTNNHTQKNTITIIDPYGLPYNTARRPKMVADQSLIHNDVRNQFHKEYVNSGSNGEQFQQHTNYNKQQQGERNMADMSSQQQQARQQQLTTNKQFINIANSDNNCTQFPCTTNLPSQPQFSHPTYLPPAHMEYYLPMSHKETVTDRSRDHGRTSQHRTDLEHNAAQTFAKTRTLYQTFV